MKQQNVPTQIITGTVDTQGNREWCPYHNGFFLPHEGETVMRANKKIRMCHHCLDVRRIPYQKRPAGPEAANQDQRAETA